MGSDLPSQTHFPQQFEAADQIRRSARAQLETADQRGLNVRCLQTASVSSTGHTRLLDPGIGAWGHRTDPSGAGPDVPIMKYIELLPASHGWNPISEMSAG